MSDVKKSSKTTDDSTAQQVKQGSENQEYTLSRDKLAFLPAALEIQMAPPAKWSRSLLWFIMSLLLIITLWACWAKIDIIAVATGKVVPSGQVKVVQPLETGVVKSIFVKEGQQVKAGDKLIALDSTANSADVERLRTEWQGYSDDLTRQQAFLTKLTDKNESQSPSLKTPVASEFITGQNPAPMRSISALSLSPTQQSLLGSHWREYLAKLAGIDSEITKLKAEKKAITIDVSRLLKTLPLVVEREQSYSKLLSTSAVSRNQYLELKQLRIDQEESINAQKARLEQIQASINATEKNRSAYIAEVNRTTLQEINQLTRQVESLKQELTKAQRLNELRILTAPVDGVVEQLAVATIGGVVTPAQELLHVIPSTQQLEVNANLLNKDIGFVHKGQVAEIKIDSFPFTKYGVIDGEVIDISADAVEDERMELLFPLKASLTATKMNIDGKWVNLKPGMSVTVEIKTGTRRLIEFLLAPLMKSVSEGARER